MRLLVKKEEKMEVKNQTYDEERALYGSRNIEVVSCRFDGPADGESALKESKYVKVRDSYFNLRYPFWHVDYLDIKGCEMTELCRAAIWYSNDVKVVDTAFHGIKALRECNNVYIDNSDIKSPEFGWSVNGLVIRNSSADSEYFMMRSTNIDFEKVKMSGKYSFQYVDGAKITDCEFNTKDAFWHAKNVYVKDSIINGEYLAWYCENVTFENCVISGTQPFCYCKGLKLINCKMYDADLAFEKSEVDAEITTSVISIKNPKSGTIKVKAVDEIIMDDVEAKGEIVLEK